MKRLRVSAVRLVGFHNYEDVLIRVRGDLFVVGANESGKTTLLDAVHLALSGEQDLDWNAAASLAGPRRSGRTLQGIILRANMAGQSTRPGGSISYAAVELAPVEGDGSPTSLVFGASAMDMHTQVQKWSAVVTRHAEDLPLTEPQPDGTQRILDRDEFETRLGHRIQKGPRGLGDYRTAVADRLFGGREQFDQVARLWRTAKSYREIASTARNIGEVFRQVLPAPDPEPFQKIAKGFRDIAGIETELQALSRDVEALHKLQTLFEETREARETFRRYAYVRESWWVRDHQAQLRKTLAQRDSATSHVGELQHQITRREERNSLVRERLAILRESDGYKLLASVEAKEQEQQRCSRRVDELRNKLRHEQNRLETSHADCEQKRNTADRALADARSGLANISDSLSEGVPEIVSDLKMLLSRLPLQVDEPLNADAINAGVASMRQRLNDAASQAKLRISDIDRQRRQLEQELHEASEQLRRITQFGDLVPALPGLDEVLLRCQQEEIEYTLLFQHLEWQPAATSEIQSAVEAALGQACLATIVFPPEQTEAARKIVLKIGGGLRVLDAAVVDFFPSTDEHGESRLLDFLTTSEPRVRAHLEATVAAVVLQREMPPDGTDAAWFAEDGTGGERGARWRLDLDEPRWVDGRRRQDFRQRKQQHLRLSVSALQEKMTALENNTAQLRSAFQNLCDNHDVLKQLSLPWSIIQPLNDWRHASDSTSELSRLIGERTAELAGELQQWDEMSQLILEMRSQIDGTDAAVIKQQIDQLELQKTERETQLVDARSDLQATQGKIAGLNERIATCELTSAEAQRRLDVARAQLVAVLVPEQTGELDHYVFDTKRGSQLLRSARLMSNCQVVHSSSFAV